MTDDISDIQPEHRDPGHHHPGNGDTGEKPVVGGAAEGGAVPVDLGPAMRGVAALLDGVTDTLLSARTPCAEYPVAALLDHLMDLTVAFQHAVRKAEWIPRGSGGAKPAPPGAPRASADRLDPRWRELLPRQLDELAAAWRDPAAWVGTAEAGGVTMPAEAMGIVALDEVLVHGWDLARATGQPYEPDRGSVEAVFGMLEETASAEGVAGMFGPAVTVPDDAPLWDRALGLVGRDPSWTP
ncbi:TIGR03086 family metal-binding protein [Streptomyces sp. LX-29]|uniref:TIGR03086 family metal-binding protein n=1 Tax=Streptomyces sp. LX-29 TaxID=2900152 RepID=UPI00240DE4A2|nr:TIGR03086 family metal-binding protein [Streptomyces sp. LX-29]WFB06897.1 TIGR03086 family metal-binding protein [Streptomyces sp. LX-29]